MTAPSQWLLLDWVLVVAAAWLLVGVLGLFALQGARLGGQGAVPRGRRDRAGTVRRRAAAMFSRRKRRAAARGCPACRSTFGSIAVGVLPAAARQRGGGRLAFAAGYFRKGEGTPPGLLCLQYHVFLASMALVLLADDAYAFMVMWETMALSSFFLVITEPSDPRDPPRRLSLPAGRPHRRDRRSCCASACCRPTPATTRSPTCAPSTSRRSGPRSRSCSRCSASAPRRASLPLHVWLPEAHPAAPSPVSALMSGVMLKTAIYGLLRVTFDLLQTQLWWWGVAAARGRPADRAVRRGVRRGADRHEAAARLLVDREHRAHRRRHRPRDCCSRPTTWRRWRRSR